MKYELQSTQTFNRWFAKLKDKAIKNQLLSRLARIENGNFGDNKALSTDLFELSCVALLLWRRYQGVLHDSQSADCLVVGGRR